MSAVVLFEERASLAGSRIGIATLNSPATLNGLSLEMVDLLSARLTAWAADPAIALVVLRGAGEKAFCAGGDLHSLYASMVGNGESGVGNRKAGKNAHALAFFTREYQLDYQIHAYEKPILCWGHGIVMGGGIGLMSGASHRVVTEASRLAMPETGIGLFPDVGGTWLLSGAPGASGRFLALTGASIDASDALYAGFADYAVAASRHEELLNALTDAAWQSDAHANGVQLDAILRAFALPRLAPSPLQRLRADIDTCCAGDSLEHALAAIADTTLDDAWWQKAQAALGRACPSSLRLSWELQQRASRLSLAEVFQVELIAALQCAAHGDFAEGIRALLIDKDKNPRWSPATLAEADARFIEAFFTPSWKSGHHPLADLGRDDRQRQFLN
jgi:enoyl-CoA hydratase/carnithine racemase